MTKIRRITLLTNPDVCNLRCPLCFLNQRGMRYGQISGINGEMDFDLAKCAITKYAAIRDEDGNRELLEVIPSTMGEPLLYTNFDKLLTLCSSLGLPMNLTTNGTFPGIWNDSVNMSRLLKGCSDIKLSSLASECFGSWKRNVERLLNLRRNLLEAGEMALASISIQVTLHKKNLMMIPEMIAWATTIGIRRIKWNTVVFLSDADSSLRNEFAIDHDVSELRNYILKCSQMCGSEIRHGGTIFMDSSLIRKVCSTDGCPFAEELWILPDGSEQHCPHPERRYGNINSSEAASCFIK